MVTVEVGYEYVVDLHGTYPGQGHLTLGALTTVQEDDFTKSFQSYCWVAPVFVGSADEVPRNVISIDFTYKSS